MATDDSTNNYTYAAFISYRHLPRDTEVAKQVQKAIETYRLPRQLRSTTANDGVAASKHVNKLGKCFRDEDELAASHSLPESIRNALAESRSLIVICSPETKESTWVQQEIETFTEFHGSENIICVLADGSSADAIPESLRPETTEDASSALSERLNEPLAADLRETARAKQRIELLRVIAAVADCNFDDLRRRDKTRRNKHIAIGTLATICLAAILASLIMQASRNSEEALIAQSKALALQAQEQLARGERMQAIKTALEALPLSESDMNRPLVPEAQQILEDALLVNRNPDQMWRPLFAFDAPDEIIAFDSNVDGGWFALLDQSGLLQIRELVTGCKAITLDLKGITKGALNFTKNDWIIKALDADSLIVASKSDDGFAFCMDAVHGKIKWGYGDQRTDSIAVSTDGTKVGIFQVIDKSNLNYTVRDIQTGKICGFAGFLSSAEASFPNIIPNVIGNSGDIAYIASPYYLAAFHLTMDESSSVIAEKTGLYLPSSLFFDENSVFSAFFNPRNSDQGANIPFALTKWESKNNKIKKVWEYAGTYDMSYVGTHDSNITVGGEPFFDCKVALSTEAIVCSAGKELYILSTSTGEELYNERFDNTIIAVNSIQLDDTDCLLAILLSDGTVLLRMPGELLQQHFGLFTYHIPYETADAKVMTSSESRGYFVIIGRSATEPKRIFGYTFDARFKQEPQDYSLDELLKEAHSLLDNHTID